MEMRLCFDCPPALLERLRARYGEGHRHYHTWSHVHACLEARYAITAAVLPEVDLALLFHDAICEPFATDNEARSAALLVDEGRREWMDDRLLQRAQALVRTTSYADATVEPETEEACIVCDADLSILGADRATFEEYERAVRQEYAAVGAAAYAAGRSAVLGAFLARPTIYATRSGQRLWEARARRNLETTLAALAQRGTAESA